MNNFRIDNKLVFVLGGAGLIGKSVSMCLAKAGAKILILDNNRKDSLEIVKNIKKIKLNASYYNFDCSHLNKIEVNLKKIINKFSTPDVFINCSYPKTKDWTKSSFDKIKLKSFRKNIDIHLNSYAWIAKYFADQMVSRKIKGSIIMVSSIYGKKLQNPLLYKGTSIKENMIYPVIKSGIIHFSNQIASYYGKYGIRVNTICPGGIKEGKLGVQDKLFIKKYLNKTPLGRMTSPEDISNAILFFSSEASSYITGQSLNVDGGFSIT